jgi:CRP-like cAMP-binding protein
MQEEAMLRERIVALGRRDAVGRVAYLLCELVWRQKAIGRVDIDTIPLPLTQMELADTLGLSAVHVNRGLQYLRREKLLTLANRTLVLLEIDKLAGLAGFTMQATFTSVRPEETKRFFEQKERAQGVP